jgi:hypothetical protein
MTAIDNTPYNKNFLSPLNFVFQIKRSPHLNFFVQEANLPSIKINYPVQTNPFVRIPISGDHVDFGPLSVTFKVDEGMQNWFEIHNWIRALGFPYEFEEYKSLKAAPSYTGDGVSSDISLIILNQIKKPIFEITFKEAFPISLSELNFKTTDDSVNYITATAQFKYILYDVVKL